mmetsp:Transcript_20342/g.44522  ORF Transcript_20342/g.44522 Transcript_20342/m.44522 type:complete len:376 (-) Transcript_20342:147-1274(-)
MATHLRRVVSSALRISARSCVGFREHAIVTAIESLPANRLVSSNQIISGRLLPLTRPLTSNPYLFPEHGRRGFAAKSDDNVEEPVKESQHQEPESKTHTESSKSDTADRDSSSSNDGSSHSKGPKHWGFGDEEHIEELIAYHRQGAYRQTREQLLANDRLRQMAEDRGFNLEQIFARQDKLLEDIPEIYRLVTEAWCNGKLSEIEDAFHPFAYSLLKSHRRAWSDIRVKPTVDIKEVSSTVLDVGPYPSGFFVGGGPKIGGTRLGIILGYAKAYFFGAPLELRANVLITSQEVHSAEALEGAEEAAAKHRSEEVREVKQLWTLASSVSHKDWFLFVNMDDNDEVELDLTWHLTDVNCQVHQSYALADEKLNGEDE